MIPHGTGCWTAVDGCLVEGTWEKGLRHGQFKFSFPVDIQQSHKVTSTEGEFIRNKKEGRHKTIYMNGNVDITEYHNDKRCGVNIMVDKHSQMLSHKNFVDSVEDNRSLNQIYLDNISHETTTETEQTSGNTTGVGDKAAHAQITPTQHTDINNTIHHNKGKHNNKQKSSLQSSKQHDTLRLLSTTQPTTTTTSTTEICSTASLVNMSTMLGCYDMHDNLSARSNNYADFLKQNPVATDFVTNEEYASIIETSKSESKSKIYGKILFQSGNLYRGGIIDIMTCHGKGTMSYKTNGIHTHLYFGDWNNNLKQGMGKMKYNDGSYFIGEWYADRRVSGKISFLNGDEFDGEWVNDRPMFGTFKTNNGMQMKGTFGELGVLTDGECSIVYPNGDTYRGSVLENKKHGAGTLVSTSGMYQGDWLNDMKHGKGETFYSLSWR